MITPFSRWRPVLFVVGLLLIVLSIAEIIPAVADAAVDNRDWMVFAVSCGLTLLAGGLLVLVSYKRQQRMDIQQGFLLTVGSWVMISLFGALPLRLSGLQLSWADAVFEAVSGLTTTGSTVLVGLDSMPPGLLLWRGLLQWLGGIGIIAMAVLLLPFLRVGGMQLFRMESSDRSDKVMPRAASVIGAIALVYLGLTLACMLAYRLAGMTGFEAIVHAMTTLSTGGYSTSDGSIGHFDSLLIDWIAILFMVLAALPFVLYVRMIDRRLVAFWHDSQVRFFLKTLAVAGGIVSLWLLRSQDVPFARAVTAGLFSVVSVVTTTGYAVEDYGKWGAFAVVLFFLLMALGGCTGSTAGGLKAFRLQVAWISIREHAMQIVQPHRVLVRSYGGRTLSDAVVASVMMVTLAFVLTVAALAVSLALTGLDPVSSISGALTAVANVGPGLGPVIGPAGNYSTLSDAAEWLMSAGMLFGRLEFVTILVILSPGFWRS